MDEAATRATKVIRLAGAPPHLAEDAITEILLRLPAKSVIRFRAVCTAWRRIATDPHFLAAHARLRPADVLFYTYLEPRRIRHARSSVVEMIALDTLPVSSDDASQRRRLISYSSKYPRKRGSCLLLSSCNGVLLFKDDKGSYILCNPVTRQWAELPWLAHGNRGTGFREYAFYFHQPSSEYRLWCKRDWFISGTWDVLCTGATEPRQVDFHGEAVRTITDLVVTTPVDLHGRLHWPPHRAPGTDKMEIVMLETLSEMFRTMAGPPISTTTRPINLFDMEGQLVVADLGEMYCINLWFLEDYDAGRWECRHRVATPWQNQWNLLRVVMMGDGEGNIILGHQNCLLKHDKRSKTLSMVNSVDTPQHNVKLSRHVFRENLVQHPYFHTRSSNDLRLIHLW
ncbi:hypothetical protein EJB05_56705, partial [Eragrostis curvula]